MSGTRKNRSKGEKPSAIKTKLKTIRANKHTRNTLESVLRKEIGYKDKNLESEVKKEIKI